MTERTIPTPNGNSHRIGQAKYKYSTKVFITLVLVVATLIIADQVSLPIIRSFTTEPPLLLTTGQNAWNILKFWELTRSGTEPIVFTGDSQMREDFSPTLFDQKMLAISGQPVTSINISVLGAGTTTSRDVIKNLLVARGVRTIFYGIDMRALNAGSELNNGLRVLFEQSPTGYALSRPSGVEQTVLLWLLEHSTLFQYRNNIRSWLTGTLPDNSADNIDERGHQSLEGVRTRDPASITLQSIPFQTNDMFVNALHEIIELCEKPDMHCIILNMPLHEQTDKLISKADEAEYEEVAFRAIQAAKLPFWNFNTPACRKLLGGDTSFFDLNHLNSDGVEKFTETLAQLYSKMLQGEVVDNVCPTNN